MIAGRRVLAAIEIRVRAPANRDARTGHFSPADREIVCRRASRATFTAMNLKAIVGKAFEERRAWRDDCRVVANCIYEAATRASGLPTTHAWNRLTESRTALTEALTWGPRKVCEFGIEFPLTAAEAPTKEVIVHVRLLSLSPDVKVTHVAVGTGDPIPLRRSEEDSVAEAVTREAARLLELHYLM